jgi:transposase
VVVEVPWADHGARSTRSFDDQVTWLAVNCNGSVVAELMRISWRTVGWIAARVVQRLQAGRDPLDGLRRIGIDETSFRKGHRYLIVIVDHDTGRLVWAAEGRDEAALDRFFYQLGEERAKLITHVSANLDFRMRRDETGMKEKMRELHVEGPATHDDPEPCRSVREGWLEALVRGRCRQGY